MSPTVEALAARASLEAVAIFLHESGREAVEKRLIYRDDLPVKPFVDWADLPEPAKEGRRLMARYLIEHWDGFAHAAKAAYRLSFVLQFQEVNDHKG